MMPFPKAEDRQTKHRQDSQMRALFVIVASYLGEQIFISSYLSPTIKNFTQLQRTARRACPFELFCEHVCFRSIVPSLEVLKTEALIGGLKFSDVASLNKMRKFGHIDNSRFSLLWAPSYFIDRISPVVTVNPTKSHVPSPNHPQEFDLTFDYRHSLSIETFVCLDFIRFINDHLKRIMSNYHKLIRPQESEPTMHSLMVG
jgi:hypothetical protein